MLSFSLVNESPFHDKKNVSLAPAMQSPDKAHEPAEKRQEMKKDSRQITTSPYPELDWFELGN
ncbi:MAG TPA: hypothetical protein VNX28_02255 [Gemmataceae bacterium]|nr:hypothetical protein [Gemmataceae bacterium]